MNKEYSQMVSNLAKPGLEICVDMTPTKAHLWHMISCIMGEVGELLMCPDFPSPSKIFKEEAGDIEFYYEGFSRGLANLPTDSFITVLSIEEENAISDETDSLSALSPDRQLYISACLIFDAIKKHLIYNKKINYCALLAYVDYFRMTLDSLYQTDPATGATKEQVLEQNMQKLLKGKNARYKEGSYSDAAAQARADKQ